MLGLPSGNRGLMSFLMHSAPPVSYHVGRSALHGVILLLLWLCALVLMLAWYGVSGDLAWPLWLDVGVLAGTGAAAWWSWVKMPEGRVGWTGQSWTWSPVDGRSMEGRMQVRLDWQRGMLLRFEGATHASHWVWVERQSQPSRWLGLRRAVYSPARMSTSLPKGALPPDTASQP